jgi:hypothetical protein
VKQVIQSLKEAAVFGAFVLPLYAGIVFAVHGLWWQFLVPWYFTGLVVMVVFSFAMYHKYNQGWDILVMHLVFSLFIAFIWLGIALIWVDDEMRHPRQETLNGDYA